MIKGYNTCQSCEQLSNEINYLRDVDMKALEQDIQSACKIIGDLLDIMPVGIVSEYVEYVEYAELFYRQHYITPPPKDDNELDELPF